MKTAIVIGGGVGGLASAIHLQRAGVRVRLLERGERIGGKLREVEVGGRKIVCGPSVLTMRWVFEELFGGAAQMAERLPLKPVDPLCRHYFPDGSSLDLFTDAERSRAAIEAFSGAADAQAYVRYRAYAARIFEIVRGPFMEKPLPSLLEMMSPRAVWGMTQIDGMRSLMRALEEFFRDPRLRQLFGRYATYNGSSPYHAPATLSVIAHVENAFGIFACEGGIYRLAEALAARATDLGVEISTGTDVQQILVGDGRVSGVRAGGAELRADAVVANCDVAHLYQKLLPDSRASRKLAAKHQEQELSLSAYLLLAVAAPAPLDLLHHNVFFSGDYRREFAELIDQRRPPADPTVYLCAEDRPGTPGSSERLFFLTNAPPLDDRGEAVDWTREAPHCRARVVSVLARHGWKLEPEAFLDVTPVEFESRSPGSRGALYGLASNSRLAAFHRPPNRMPGMLGLYLAGGSVHPGAGLPMACLSARIASELALSDLGVRA